MAVNPTPLPSEFNRDGVKTRFVWRGAGLEGAPIAVFRHQSRFPRTEDNATFDVFLVQTTRANTVTIRGKSVRFEAKETMPGASTWGRLGWSPVGMRSVVARLSAMGVPDHQLPTT